MPAVASVSVDAPPRLLGTRDVAAMFSIHERTVYAWIESGTLPKPFKVGKKLFWRPEAIAKLLGDAA